MELMRDLPAAGRKKTCVIVCGMHRTGTSAVARVINLLGADIGKDLIAPRTDNIRGYWESQRVVQVHNRLLEDLGSSSADPLPLPDDWLRTPFAQHAHDRLADLIESEFQDSSLFVVKDPRISKLLPLWTKLLAELDIEIVVVLTFRNPLEVAASLQKRDRLPLTSSLLLYLVSYLKSELASRGHSRLFVSYAHALSDWPFLEGKLRSILGSRLPGLDEKRSLEISQHLVPELRHHHYDRVDLARGDEIPSAVADLYDLLTEVEAAGNDDASHFEAFDKLERSVDSVAALFRDLILGERAERRAFENSTSWRITAPLRWLTDNFRAKARPTSGLGHADGGPASGRAGSLGAHMHKTTAIT
jgi:hypothetical protein